MTKPDPALAEALDPRRIEAYRLQLRSADFAPIPVNGKAAYLDGWQRLGDVTDLEIKRWTVTRPAESNTGILTRRTPTLDTDILDPECVEAIERFIREQYEELGVFLVRIGRFPKRAFPFSTDEPFDKITINLVGPLGPEKQEKLEFLANGQQFVADGIHPDTRQLYSWHGGRPGDVKRGDLPPVDERKAKALANGAAEIAATYGYARKAAKAQAKQKVTGQDDSGPGDWVTDFADHDQLAALAMKLLKSSMGDGAAVNFLRDNVEALTNIDPDRKARRLNEIPGMVTSARAKLGDARPPIGSYDRGAPPIGEKLDPHRSHIDILWHGDRTNEPLVDWSVEGMFYRVGLGMICGQWGTYKTFVGFDLSAAIMTKTPFAGRAVNHQGGVLFIAAEGQAQVPVRVEGIALRVAKLAQDEDTVRIDPARMPFAWTKQSPRLSDPEAFIELRALISATKSTMQDRFGLPLALAIIDALMPAAQFKDADKSTESRQVMDMLAAVARDFKILIVVIDHFGKDVSTGTRNASTKEDAADSILALLGERSLEGKVSNPRMAVRKVKGEAQGSVIPFEPREIAVSETDNGRPIKTLTIDWQLDGQEKVVSVKRPKSWPKSLSIFKRALDKMLCDCGKRLRPFLDGPEVLAVRAAVVRAEFLKAYPAENADPKLKAKAKAKAFERGIKQAIDENLVCARELASEDFDTFYWRLDVE